METSLAGLESVARAICGGKRAVVRESLVVVTWGRSGGFAW